MITDRNGKHWYKVNLHTHTTRSDGHVSPEEAARIYRDAGYDALAITDHWAWTEDVPDFGGIYLMGGAEYDGKSTEGFLSAMDKAMYAAKKEYYQTHEKGDAK